jgi:hypothetical protein
MAVGASDTYSLFIIKMMEQYSINQTDNLPRLEMGEQSYHAHDFNDIAWSHDNLHVYT